MANGRYIPVRRLARGGMGELWLAHSVGVAGWKRTVVVKRALEHLEDDPDFRSRFLDEANLAAGLTHSGIVQVLDLGEDELGLFLVLEWVDGIDLRRLLRAARDGAEPLPEPLIASIAADLCDALDAVHDARDERGAPLHIVHRDVSPSNVMLARDGTMKLADFGVASARLRRGRTITGQLRGKFAYMSPEQASGGTVDARSDVFGVGVLLFEMLTLTRPFEGSTDLETLARVQRAERVAVDTLRPDTSVELAAIVERALAASPSDRFPSARALERALRPLCTPDDRRARAERVAALVPPADSAARLSLDDALNAQLEVTPSASAPVPRPSPSGSRSARVPGLVRTVTRAAPVVPALRRRGRLGPALALALAVSAALAWGGRAWHHRDGVLAVTSVPDGAAVFVDGVERGATNLRSPTDPGTHEIAIRLGGYAPVVRSELVRPGRVSTISVALAPEDRPVEFHSVPAGARVTVAGRTIAAGNALSVPVGRPVLVRMVLEGFEPLEERVSFAAGDRIFTRALTPVAATPATDVAEAATPGRRGIVPASPPIADPEPGVVEGSGAPAAPAGVGQVILRFGEPPLVGDIAADGRALGRNTDLRQVIELPVGPHVITVSNAERALPFTARVQVVSDQEVSVTVDWPDQP